MLHKNSPNEHLPLSIFFSLSSITVDSSRLRSWRSIYFFLFGKINVVTQPLNPKTVVNEFLTFLDLLSTIFFFIKWTEMKQGLFLEHCQF